MTTFTLIAYRPDYDEYHGNYRYDSSDSDFEIKQCESLEKIVEEGINYYFNEKSNRYSDSYGAWELTLLIDGRQESYDESELSEQDWVIRNLYKSKVDQGILVRQQLIKQQKIEAEKERKRLETEAKIQAEIRAKKYQEEQELIMYNRLKLKYDKS